MKSRFINMAFWFAALMSMVSCDEWVTPQPADYGYGSGRDRGEAYLKSLREWKSGDHLITMVVMESEAGEPSRQPQHPMSMPDSVDYICLREAWRLHPLLAAEIGQVLRQKGTQTLCVADYTAIEDEWTAMIEDASQSGLPLPTLDEFRDYCTQRTRQQIEACDKLGCAGMAVSFTSRAATAGTGEELRSAGEEIFMSQVLSWRAVHGEKVFVVHGYVPFIDAKYRHSLVVGTKPAYVVIRPTTTSVLSMTSTVTWNIESEPEMPTDRMLFETFISTEENPSEVGDTPLSTAQWMLTPDSQNRFSKRGVFINNAQEDYYHPTLIYCTLREVISAMNPAAEK